MKKGFFLVLIVVLVLLLNGCCCVVCPPIEQQFKPEILIEGMTKCDFLDEEVREVTTETDLRYVKDKLYSFTSLEDTQIIFENFDIRQTDAIKKFHSLPGCKDLPFGYMEYPNGMKVYITAVYNVYNSKIEFYKVYIDKLVRFYDDKNVVKIAIY
jgi:hypothetical protein